MVRGWPGRRLAGLSLLLGGVAGCTQTGLIHWASGPSIAAGPAANPNDGSVRQTGHQISEFRVDAAPILDRELTSAMAGTTTLNACIQAALETNALIRAARFNVEALRQRIPQVTALDDPILSNTIYPIPSVAPQYSLMGYMPYGALLAQQFPWCGTLRLRGQAAEHDVRIAWFELAATELDAIAAVKRAYFDLHFTDRAEALLRQNRKLAEEFLDIARVRYPTATASQPDVLRAGVALSDVDRELANNTAARDEARAELAKLMHQDSETRLQTTMELSIDTVPTQLDRLQQLALASRPDLQGRLAAIGRDEAAIALARKRYYPNLTLGLVYQDMEKTNAMTPKTAGGMPNVGLFVGMNLPVYHKKMAAGVCEAQARAAANRALYEAETDQSHRDIKSLFAQARAQERIVALLRKNNLPAAMQVLRLTSGEYRHNVAGVDFLNVLSAWRELLQVELQIAQIESELGKTLASLERAVGAQWNEHPPEPASRSLEHPDPPKRNDRQKSDRDRPGP